MLNIYLGGINMTFGLFNLLFAVALTFLLTVGLMYAVSGNDNPTPTQIRNRIIMRRKWRKIKKALTPDDIIFPMLLGLLGLGIIGYLAVQLSIGGIG
tara:strand:+ start:45 stop:335 length:291 start_codon:yes stop_codon:yes gene_type:complete